MLSELSTGPGPRWTEPTRALPLRWGRYDDRYAAGLLLIVGGGVQLQGSNTWTPQFLLIGTLAHVIGWSIMPARGGRRLLAVVAATAQLWVLLAGPAWAWSFVVPYLCWLGVRHRPARSYITALIPLASGLVIPALFTEYSGMPAALAVSAAVLAGSAWLARLIAARPRRRSQRTGAAPLPTPSNSG